MRLSIMVSELTGGTTLASSPDGTGEWWRALFSNCNEKKNLGEESIRHTYLTSRRFSVGQPKRHGGRSPSTQPRFNLGEAGGWHGEPQRPDESGRNEREIFKDQQEITTFTVIWARQLVSPQPKLGPVP